MNDLIFIPRHLTNLLLDDLIGWEAAESISTLLTISIFREPVEEENHFYKYVVRSREVSSRVFLKTNWEQYCFSFKLRDIPYIHNFSKQGSNGAFYSYEIHEAVHPKHHVMRHRKIPEFNCYPVDLWLIPRHVLIRWRYSAKMPIHRSNFVEKEELGDQAIEGKPISNLSEAIVVFKAITKMFRSVMRACDVSSVSYSFVCYVYFYAHDVLIYCLRNEVDKPNFYIFLQRLKACFHLASFYDAPSNKKVQRLEGLLRAVVPNGFFNTYPYSLFSVSNFTKVR